MASILDLILISNLGMPIFFFFFQFLYIYIYIYFFFFYDILKLFLYLIDFLLFNNVEWTVTH